MRAFYIWKGISLCREILFIDRSVCVKQHFSIALNVKQY